MSFNFSGSGSHVISRHDYGGNEASNFISGTMLHNAATNFNEYTGKGYFYYGFFRLNSTPTGGKSYTYPRILVDDVVVRPYGAWIDLQTSFKLTTTTAPCRLLDIGTDSGKCEYFFNPPLYFDTSIKLGFTNTHPTTDFSGAIMFFYTKV